MTLDEVLAAAVKEAVDAALAPYLKRLADPDPLVYTVPKAAKALSCSDFTIRQLVKDGVLSYVPHMGENKRVIPRDQIEALVASAKPTRARGAA